MTRERLGGIGVIALGLLLIFMGFTALVAIGIPVWVLALAQIITGVLILFGR